MASPPGFTSAPTLRQERAIETIEPMALSPPAVSSRAESTARLEAKVAWLKAESSLAVVESQIREWYPELRKTPLTPELVATHAVMFREDYKEALERRDKAKAAYEASVEPRATGRLAPREPADSKVLPALKGVGRKRTTRKRRETRNGPPRLQRHRAGRLSRRKVKA